MNSAFEPLAVPCFREPEPDGVVFAVGETEILLGADGDGGEFPPASALGLPRGLCIGALDGRPCYAVDYPVDVPPPAGYRPAGVRETMRRLDPARRQAFGRARQLLYWIKRHRHCGGCGEAMTLSTTEIAAVCPRCGGQYFPNIAPAVITAVRRGDALLLARNRNFKPGLYSLIAGYVEAGESLEMAVAREIAEEVGIEVDNIRYFGSQSWPFPSSLMLGFTADYAGGELRPDGVEITEAGFFRAGEFPEVPPPGSISRELIDAFLTAGEIPPR